MKIGCIIMASGQSTRFGSNKLLAEFQGKRLIDIIIERTSLLMSGCDEDFSIEIKRLVLTRTKEVASLCEESGVPVVLHQLQNRNDAVRLGILQMADCDACIFCTCDQPLLKKESIERLIYKFSQQKKGIYRLASENTIGNPILFSKELFEELSCLPEKRGGSYLAEKYPKKVTCVQAENELELYDVDTPEDLMRLAELM